MRSKLLVLLIACGFSGTIHAQLVGDSEDLKQCAMDLCLKK